MAEKPTYEALEKRVRELERKLIVYEDTERGLRESEEKYRTLFDDSRDAIFITSRDGRVIDVNPAFLKLFGYTREELGADFQARELYLDPNDRTDFQEQIEREGATRNYEVSLRKKDGAGIHCHLTAAVWRSSDGNISGYQGIIRDVTEQRRTEAALRESAVRYRAIVGAFDGLVYICSQDYRIEFMNERCIERTGYDGTGHYCYKALHDLDSICPWCVNERVFKGETVRWELQSPRDNSWFYVVNTPIYHENGSVSKQAMILDITDRKQKEKELEESSEKIKLFAYSISHDLKSLSIGLHGFSKRLYKNHLESLDEKGRRYCEQILNTTELMASLIEQINIFVSTKETPLNLETLQVKDILRTIREEFFPKLKTRKIRWIESDRLPEIKADKVSAIRVIRNLVDNALKYGGDQLSEIRVEYDENPDYHVLSIQDNGVGLKEKDVPQDLFRPFVRKKTSRGVEGSGLGLAIVKEIAEKHGGRVWLEPGSDRGVAVYLSIPKNPRP